MVSTGHLSSSSCASGRANRTLSWTATTRGNRPPQPRCARAPRRTSLSPLRPSFTARHVCGGARSFQRPRWPPKRGRRAAQARAPRDVWGLWGLEWDLRPWLGPQKRAGTTRISVWEGRHRVCQIGGSGPTISGICISVEGGGSWKGFWAHKAPPGAPLERSAVATVEGWNAATKIFRSNFPRTQDAHYDCHIDTSGAPPRRHGTGTGGRNLCVRANYYKGSRSGCARASCRDGTTHFTREVKKKKKQPAEKRPPPGKESSLDQAVGTAAWMVVAARGEAVEVVVGASRLGMMLAKKRRMRCLGPVLENLMWRQAPMPGFRSVQQLVC